jgi:hypothetical protein
MNFPKEKDLDFSAVLIGGSHLYGLNTAESDIDYRGVYRTKSLSAFLGLADDDCHGMAKEEGDDYVYFELRRFLELLKKTNTNSIEILYAPDDAFMKMDADFALIRQNKDRLINSNKLLHSTRGYVYSETRLALGERTGKLGGKRKEKLEIYGYSPKNVVQILRIVAATRHFLETGYYPVTVNEISPSLHDVCMEIKTHPEKFSLDTIKKLVEAAAEEVQELEDKVNITFDQDLASELAWGAYKNQF